MAIDPNPGAGPGADVEQEPQSVAGLLHRLVEELSGLFRQELALARAEITEKLTAAVAGVIAFAAGAAALLSALLVLLAAAVLALALVMPAWLAAVIVAAVMGVTGYLLLTAGRRRLEPSRLTPTRSPKSLQRDAKVLRRQNP